MMKINIKATLKLFDEIVEINRKRINGVISMLGEELGAELFRHYLKRHHARSKVIYNTPTTGRKKGPRLDCWICVDRLGRTPHLPEPVLFQTEIKNWSAYSLNRKSLSITATPKQRKERSLANWETHWDILKKCPKHHRLRKVLVEMTKPDGVIKKYPETQFKRAPLVIMWEVLHPQGKTAPFFIEDVGQKKKRRFNKIWFFSMSAYLREHLSKKYIALDMPSVDVRRKLLKSLFSKTSR